LRETDSPSTPWARRHSIVIFQRRSASTISPKHPLMNLRGPGGAGRRTPQACSDSCPHDLMPPHSHNHGNIGSRHADLCDNVMTPIKIPPYSPRPAACALAPSHEDAAAPSRASPVGSPIARQTPGPSPLAQGGQ
jgi:hypothetical protein